MAKLNKNKTETIYDSYGDYVNEQRKKFHQYDCPNCFKINSENVAILRSKNIPFTSILDCGARDFSWSDPVVKEGIKCVGIDISPESVGWAKSNGRDIVLGDVSELTKHFPENFVDVVLSNHNLEHVLLANKFMEEAYKVLTPGGHIFIRCPYQKVLDGDFPTAHCRCYTEDELKNLALNAKFVIAHYEYRKDSNEHILIAKKA